MNLQLLTGPGRIDFLVRGERFTSYYYSARGATVETPGFSSLYAARLRPVTRPNNRVGRDLWIGHGAVNGIAFGCPVDAGAQTGVIATREMTVRRGAHSVGFLHECDWLAPDGACVLQDSRLVRITPGPSEGAVLDLALTLTAQDADASLGETEHALLMVRAASALLPSGAGQIRNSMGDYGVEEIQGHTAEWCACTGVVQGETVGMAILEHPANPWHPTAWRATPDGLIAACPFLWHSAAIPAHRSVLLRYRIMVHTGYVEAGWAQARLGEWVRERGGP